MNKRKSGILTLIVFTVVAIVHVVDIYKVIPFNLTLLKVLRWVFIFSLVLFALYKKSLTTWILTSMVIGVEIGLDFPVFATNLKVLSNIFLRLVKTIIAPILFSTLVVGIAGHSDLKQVGRMGWKSIVYFEVVTTIALFIGLTAINITKAGVGIHIPEVFIEELPHSAPHTGRM